MGKENERSSDMAARFLAALDGYRRLVIVGHDNPDPDFLASALGLRHIARSRAGLPSTVSAGGVMGRAENRAMARLLKIEPVPVSRALFSPGTAVVLVDTQPRTGNNSLPEDVSPLAVIDHHPRRSGTAAAFLDIRPDYGATSTIVAGYLMTLGAEPPPDVATGLAYGITAETMDLSRETGESDIRAYLWALRLANKRLLAQITHPKVSRYYFTVLGRALNSAFYYRNIIGARLGEVLQPDVVAQVSDLLLSHERMSWSICTGFHGDLLLVSVRSSCSRASLGPLMRKLVARRGTAGGHELSAGAQVPCRDLLPAERLRLEESLILDFMHRVTHQKDIEPKALLPRP